MKAPTRGDTVWWGCWLPLLVAGCSQTPEAAQTAGVEFGAIRYTVGALEEPSSEVFGEIRDVELAAEGRVVVLDRQSSQVRLFDGPDARFVAAVGAYGDGPGEFDGPLAIALPSDSILVVLGRSNRLSEFRIGPGGFDHLGDTRLSFFARDLCSSGGTLVAQGQVDGLGIHVLDHDGAIVTSFHGPPEHGFDLGDAWNPVLTDQALTGTVGCAARSDMVVFASSWLPGVATYRSNGDQIWEVELPGFVPVAPRLTDEGRALSWDRGEGADGIVSVEITPDGSLVLVQTVHLRGRQRPTEVAPRTYVLDGRTGALLFDTRDLGRLMSVEDSFLVTLPSREYPFLAVRSWQSR